MAIFGGTGTKREKREKRERYCTFSLQSKEISQAFFDGLRFKVGVLDESYAWIPETPNFTKVSREGSES